MPQNTTKMKFKIILALFLFSGISCQKNGSHQHQSSQTNNTQKVLGKDYVCEMEVSDGTFKAEYQGNTYYFCAKVCKEEFLKDPEKYLSKK